VAFPATTVASGERSARFERRRQVRDAVEAALSDVILLGTEEQVRLAARAVNEMVAGRAIETAPLVASLRTFIRKVLGLEQIPPDVVIPKQGPVRPGAARGARDDRERSAGAGRGGGQGSGGGAGGLGLPADGEHSSPGHQDTP